jgi:hypothetical protein
VCIFWGLCFVFIGILGALKPDRNSNVPCFVSAELLGALQRVKFFFFFFFFFCFFSLIANDVDVDDAFMVYVCLSFCLMTGYRLEWLVGMEPCGCV